jgi:aspartyl-tRNA synthetase
MGTFIIGLNFKQESRLAEKLKWKRSHTCGELNETHQGKTVTLTGWVASQRDLGGMIFIDLRDRWGVTQVVFHPGQSDHCIETAKALRMESVIGIRGEVSLRPKDMVNSKMATGAVEIRATDLFVFNESKPLPFLIKDPCDATDENRLKYRYLDLRRPAMQKNLFLRHRMAQLVRRFFDGEGFIEVETPVLMKSTPEGARDYLVPSRIHRGKFYALPQSPQQYKQILMVSGFERYFQIVRCFRDEDLRADRQPEFTQIDVEMSFVDEDDILSIMEKLTAHLFQDVLGIHIPTPFQRISYDEAVSKYGTDRPDLRFGMEIRDISAEASGCGFRVFEETVEKGGKVRGIKWEGAGKLTRKQVDDLTAAVQAWGARGLVVVQKTGEGLESPVSKFITAEKMEKLAASFRPSAGDVLLMAAGEDALTRETLGNLRKKIAADRGMIRKDQFIPVWVVDFPLLEWNPEEKRYQAMHHPFTSPKEEDLPLLNTDPGKVRARAYDLVLNGSEIAGGSIRNHRHEVQQTVFKALGIDPDTAERKFGFLLEALQYGAPPHGGIAFGFDRLVMIFAGEESIREVIAFPKTTSALSLMDGCPSEVGEDQLKELGLDIIK